MTDIVERLRGSPHTSCREDGHVQGFEVCDHNDEEIIESMERACIEAADEIERLRAELERERAFKESYYGQLQDIFAKYAKYKQWFDKPDGYVGDAPYWKGPSKND